MINALVLAVGAVGALVLTTQAPSAAAVPQGAPARAGGVNGQVYATAVSGHTVYVGGAFTLAQTQGGASSDRSNLAAFDLNTGALVGSWRADVSGTVRSLAASGNYLYVGGAYNRIGGVAQHRLARVSLSTGDVDTGFRPQLNATVRGVDVANGRVYAGGQFTSAGGSAANHLAAFDATSGARIGAFDGGANGPVYVVSVSPDGTELAVGGDFTTLSGATRVGQGLVRTSSGSSVGPAFANSIAPTLTLSWSTDGTTLYAGSGGAGNRAGRWNASTGARPWSFRAGGDIQAVGYFDGELYVGFHDNYNDDTHTHLLAVDASSGTISGFRPVFNQFWGVRSISAGSWGLIIGGQFTSLSGVWAHNWGYWPSDRTSPSINVDSPKKSAYGKHVKVTVDVGNAAGTVTLTRDGTTPQTQALTDGTATFKLPRTLDAGKHTLTVDYSGDLRHAAGSTTKHVKVTRAVTKVHTTVVRKATTKRVGKVKVLVTSKPKRGAAPVGTVSLTLTSSAKKRTVLTQPLTRDTATFKLPKLSAGTWKLVATYSGDTNHKAASHTTKVRVTKAR
jgi:hypothetical protein